MKAKKIKEIKEKPFKHKDKRLFGFKPRKDKIKIQNLRKWCTCSFCGRPSEVRPHAPVNWNWFKWEYFPIRLCFFCASIQENVRDMVKSIIKKDGN